MAGTHRSGGQNRIPVAEHQLRGTLRPARHLVAAALPPEPISTTDRRRTLKGLPAGAKRIAAALLATYDDWGPAQLETARAYALSCSRLEGLQSDPAADVRLLHAEIRCNLNLLKGLDLETAK